MRRSTVRCGCLLVLFLLLPGCQESVSPEALEAMLRQGQTSEALAKVRDALDRDPGRSDLQLFYGKLLVHRKDFHLALWPLREAARDPEYATRARLLIAQTQLAIGNGEEALAALDEILEREPDHPGALKLRANAHLEAMKLDQALKDADLLLERDPEDLETGLLRLRALLLLERAEEAETALNDLKLRLSEDPDRSPPGLRARVCVAEAVFMKEKGDLEAWHEKAIGCSDEFPGDRLALQEALEAHVRRGERQAATDRIEVALEAAPEDGRIRFLLAERYRKLGDQEKGERILRDGIERFDPPRSQDWRLLYEYFWQSGNFEAAREALERAIELIPDPSTADLLLLADVLIEADELDRAREIAGRLGEGYRDLVWGRIRLEEGDYEGARTALLSGLRVWPNNAVARILLARVASRRGHLDEALEQYIEAYRIDQGQNAQVAEKTDAAREIARIELALGAYEHAMEFASNHVGAKPGDFEGYALMARAAARAGVPKVVTTGLNGLSSLPGGHARAVALQARLVLDAEGADAAVEAIRRWRPDLQDPANAPVLEVWIDLLSRLGKHDEAVETVLRASRAAPESPIFRALLARARLRAGGDVGEVRAELERALELDSGEPMAWWVLGDLEGRVGNVDAALAAYDRVRSEERLEIRARLAAGRLLAESPGRREEARRRLERLLVDHPLASNAATLLAELALEANPTPDLDRALAWASRAARLAGGLPLREASRAYGVLGRVHMAREETEKARGSFEFALQLDPGNVEARGALAGIPSPEAERG